MNKKIFIGVVTVVVLAVGGLIGYKIWDNKKVEKEKAEMEEQQKNNTPAYQQNENGDTQYSDDTTDSEKNIIEVRNFFYDCLNYSLNVPDTKNKEIMANIKKYQSERFSENYLTVMDKFYSQYDKLKLGDYAISEVGKTIITTKDGEKKDGYYVNYTATFNDGKEDNTLHEEGSQAKALIAVENGHLTLRQFTTYK